MKWNMIVDISNIVFDICKIIALLRFAYFLIVERGQMKRKGWNRRNNIGY